MKSKEKAGKENEKYEKATFAMGCFWGVQAIFDSVNAVISTIVGYTGGHTKDPSYESICFNAAEHAEAIEITFNPKIVNYDNLLKIFWMNRDPTTKDRQGPDIGSQYRSAIFYHGEKQKNSALKSKELFQKKLEKKKIVAEISQAKEFYPAEDYHQKYYKKHNIARHIKYE